MTFLAWIRPGHLHRGQDYMDTVDGEPIPAHCIAANPQAEAPRAQPPYGARGFAFGRHKPAPVQGACPPPRDIDSRTGVK